MDTQLLNEVIACLPEGKTHYRYFKGAYASRLLSMLMPEQASVHELKQTRFKKLLEHPTVKPAVAHCGQGTLTQHDLSMIWQEPSRAFLLTVSRWGGKGNRAWHQTSRYGENLVLQLNLPMQHRRRFLTDITPDQRWSINGEYTSHPVQKVSDPQFRDTLAWSRIDIDFDYNEALIEEVQSDGVRNIRRWAQYYRRDNTAKSRRALNFVRWFERYAELWSEAILCATIEFVHHELGIERIFMHTARSGWQVKNMHDQWRPPRSLYSDLPKRFAFKQTWAAPEFLLDTKCYQRLIRKQPDIDFYQLSINELRDAISSNTIRTQTNIQSNTEPLHRHSERSEESLHQPTQLTGGTPCHAE